MWRRHAFRSHFDSSSEAALLPTEPSAESAATSTSSSIAATSASLVSLGLGLQFLPKTMADLGLDDYYVHVGVPKATMQISSTEEPDVYSASTINLWGRRLAGYSLAREVKAIITLAFTRPKLLSLVMTERKRQTKQLIRLGTLARQRERMKLLRAARWAARLLPPPPPPVPDFMDVEWAARVLPPPPVPDLMDVRRAARRAARFLKPLPPVIPLMNGSIQLGLVTYRAPDSGKKSV